MSWLHVARRRAEIFAVLLLPAALACHDEPRWMECPDDGCYGVGFLSPGEFGEKGRLYFELGASVGTFGPTQMLAAGLRNYTSVLRNPSICPPDTIDYLAVVDRLESLDPSVLSIVGSLSSGECGKSQEIATHDPGQTTIIARGADGQEVDLITAHVYAIAGLSLFDELRLVQGQRHGFAPCASLVDAEGRELSGYFSVEWHVEDPTVVVLLGDGHCTGIEALQPGSTRVTARAPELGLEASGMVFVTAAE